jgi:ADP-ribose pyrophosphatase YjhB (NUDIX family)
MMKNTNIKLHYFQVELIKKMSLNQSLRFNDLLIEGLESEHMNYHLKQLLDLGFVIKENTRYRLTDSGKDYSNLLDESSDFVEKQPKTSIIIHAVRKNSRGEVEHLLMKRLRQPYFGKVGHPTGKVKFGETIVNAVKRELFEETGLTAKLFQLERVYHKMRRRNGEYVQDVIFYVFMVKNLSGTLIAKTKYQENFWITKKELAKRQDLDFYDDFTMDDHLKPKPLIFNEDSKEAEGF